MPISTRNRFSGTVAAVKEGAINGTVTVEVGGLFLKAGITMDSIRRLGLAEGSPAEVVVRVAGDAVPPRRAACPSRPATRSPGASPPWNGATSRPP